MAGGLRISEPAADLAVAAALISAACDRPVPDHSVLFGEIGLSGEIRAVSQGDQRLKEASKLGFKHAFVPVNRSKKARLNGKLTLQEVAHLQDLVASIAAGGARDRLQPEPSQ